MKKRILPIILCACLLLSAATVGVFAATPDEGQYTAQIMDAYGGAKGIVSMMFDDGDWQTNEWLNEQFKKYDLYGTNATIVRSNYEVKDSETGTYSADPDKLAKWKELYADGRIEPESHSYTHLVLPADKWANTKDDPESYLANNTEENYQIEIVKSQQLIKQYFNHDSVCFIPSNNTLSEGAMAVVKQHYYAVRQGNNVRGTLQSLDPVPGSHEKGGWYNLYMYSFGNSGRLGIQQYIPAAVEQLVEEGGWLVAFSHSIREGKESDGTSYDATYAEAEALFKTLNRYQNEGLLWVTTFGRATKYLREKQNSTVSYSYSADKVTVSVTMAEMTADNLPLTADVFNHPLTVKIELPGGVERVSYPLDGKTQTANAFVEGGKTYAYVNVIPNSGEVEIKRIAEGGIFSLSDLATALTTDGEYKVAGDIVVDGTANLTMTGKNIVLDLCGNTISFEGRNTITVPEGASLTVKNGDVIVACSYKSSKKKDSVSYFPIVKNDDGTYGVYQALNKDGKMVPTAVSYSFTGVDAYRTNCEPAFRVNGGSLLLDGVTLERAVSVSNSGEVLVISAGETTLKNSKLFDSAPVEAWSNTATRLISMTRQTNPTKLTVINSTITQTLPNAYYTIDGMEQLINQQNSLTAEGVVDPTTGVIDKSKVKYTINTNDNIDICYVIGTEAGTGVEIVVEESHFETYQNGFRGDKNNESTDKFTMRNTRFENLGHISNYNDRVFGLYSAEMLFENCFLEFPNNVFYMQDYSDYKASGNTGTTSVTLKNSYFYAARPFRCPSNNNTIRIENSFVAYSPYQWSTTDTEGNDIKPTVTIVGSCYTAVKIYESGTYPSSNTTSGWFNVILEEGATFERKTPNWYLSVSRADGSTSVIAKNTTSTPFTLLEGDKLYVWQNYTDAPIYLSAASDVDIRTYGMRIDLAIQGEGMPVVEDGGFGAVSVIRADGYHRYYVNDTEKTLENTFSSLENGQTLVLHADQQVKGTATETDIGSGLFVSTAKKVALDLNGYTVYHTSADETLARIEPMFGTSSKNGAELYIYSSREGGRLLNGYTTKVDVAGYILRASKGKLALGYGIDGEKRGERFSVIGGALIDVQSDAAFLANGVDFYSVSGDNNTTIRFSQNVAGKKFYATNCNFYSQYFNYFINFSKVKTYTVDIVFEDSNIYSNSTTRWMWADGYYDSADALGTKQTIVLRNTSVYSLKMNTAHGKTGAPDMVTYVIEGECNLPAIDPTSEYVDIAPGYFYENASGKVTVSGTSYPYGSVYGGAEQTKADASYPYVVTIRSSKDYQKSLYSNVALDTALDLKLYVPVDATLTSVTVDGTEVFDKEAVQTINGKDYYVITVSKAPKAANEVSDIYFTYENGTNVKVYRLQQSLLNYARTLLRRDESKYTGKTLEYLVDSKEMMRYVLNYAKEAITRYNDLEGDTLAEALAPIEALLGEFALSESDKVLEDVKTDLPSGIGAAAAFDLDTKVGFVLGVYNTFTGTVSIRVDDREVTKSFTADENAAEIADMLVLENILAYQLYEKDIEISIQGTNGDEAVDVTFTYNLATYANSGVSGEVGTALYAYAKEAYEYGFKHSVGTIE